MYDRHLITFKEKDKYYNKIYPTLHPMYDPKTRVYTKNVKDCDFEFKDGKLIYTKGKDLDLTNAEKIFPSFKNLNKENTVQETISYYLNNNIVPGFCAENFDNFKKENVYQSKELTNPETYETDKTFNILKDDLSIYNEKFFLEKEIDKKRKKNEAEKLGKDPKK